MFLSTPLCYLPKNRTVGAESAFLSYLDMLKIFTGPTTLQRAISLLLYLALFLDPGLFYWQVPQY